MTTSGLAVGLVATPIETAVLGTASLPAISTSAGLAGSLASALELPPNLVAGLLAGQIEEVVQAGALATAETAGPKLAGSLATTIQAGPLLAAAV